MAADEDAELKVGAADARSGDVRASDVCGVRVGGEHLEVRPRGVGAEGGERVFRDVAVASDGVL